MYPLTNGLKQFGAQVQIIKAAEYQVRKFPPLKNSPISPSSQTMLNCPRCNQLVNSKAVNCPYCQTVLKAYGHPGITLHRATGEEPLCKSCIYHADDTCTFTQRPHAKECTLYNDISPQQLEPDKIYNPRRGLLESGRIWCQRNPGLLGFGVLIVVSLLLTLMANSK